MSGAMRVSAPETLTEELGLLMGKVRRKYWTIASRQLEASGESLSVWHVLSQLVRVEKSTQNELAAAIGYDAPTISRLLDGLEREQLVRRNRDPDDRRRVCVQLTKRGRTRYTRMRPAICAAVECSFRPLNSEERSVLRNILLKLVSDEPVACVAHSP
jgi:DNA-binding MarR family transcriptional regulator